MKPIAILIFLALSTAMAEQIGSFLYIERVDPITDEDTSFAVAVPIDKNERFLLLRCKNKKLEVLYSTNVYLGSATEFNVIYRFDNREPSKTEKWSASVTRQSVFFPMNSEETSSDFKIDLITWDKIVIRVYDFKETAYTDTFLLSGAMELASRMNCFWY